MGVSDFMIIDNANKLAYFEDLYKTAKAHKTDIEVAMQRNKEQYDGSDEIDGSTERAKVVRNITYELIESQVSSTIPTPAVNSEVWSEQYERNAKNVEQLLTALRNKLPFEKHNDIDERYSPIYGASVWLVEWDNSILTHNTVGDVKVSVHSPLRFIPQPYVYDLDDMEYCFIEIETTKEDIMRKYGVTLKVAEEAVSSDADGNSHDEETATVIVCYYKNAEDKICQYIFAEQTELKDIDDYYSRRKTVCKKCGKREELCECDKPEYETLNDEYEELEEDVMLSDGTALPALSPKMKDGEILTETKQVPAIVDGGSVALQDINGVSVPQMIEIQSPKLERTKLPYYKPNKFPIVIRKNTSQEDSLFGQSDCAVIRDQQQTINKLESRILEKLVDAGVFGTVPDDWSGSMDNSIYKNFIRVKVNNYKLFNRIDLQVNIAQDIAQSDRVYDHAKRILGISDSFQGHEDRTAQSGVAKQVQVAQSAGRLDSKRKMKNAAYAEIDEVIFQLYLAYSDEPRNIAYKDSQGRLHNAQFNRYDFIERDERGEYYYNDCYLFATSPIGDIEQDRQLLWQEARLNFQNGCYGNPQELTTLLIYWQNMEKAHYPNARENVERFAELVNQQQMAMEKQLEQQGQQIQSQQQQLQAADTNARGYAEYINNYYKGNQQVGGVV